MWLYCAIDIAKLVYRNSNLNLACSTSQLDVITVVRTFPGGLDSSKTSNTLRRLCLHHESIRHKQIWSGWQELNLREHAPKACGWPLPYTRILVARHGIEPCPLVLQTSTLPSSSRANIFGAR